MGWWCSDTASLHFDDVRVPAANLIGEENAGFRAIMRNFNSERLGMAAGAVGFAQTCLEDALDWARARQTFGKPLIGHQAIRHKLVDMQARVHAARALLYDTAWKLREAPREPAHIAQLAMLKNVATDAMQSCADAAVQTLGGAGFMRGTPRRAHLPRGQGDADRRRQHRDHEGPGRDGSWGGNMSKARRSCRR